ncbi:MAG: Argininosuccinate lyase [Gemmatimonadaceae bacterium]|nr:Argininosuccinate lyase [Gemmatimonadaceae bacterium]
MTRVGLVTDSSHKLWGGRFSGRTSPIMDAVNRSIGVDFRLWPFDIRLSKAWAVALWSAGVLTLEESKQLERGLDAVARRFADGESPAPSDEDVHTMIDRLLHEEIGDVASRLHTGRSRNDQVATATRMWAMDACQRVDEAIRELQSVMLRRARELQDAMLPAYTHMQRAQPVSAAHWMLSHFWPLDRDRLRLAAAARGASTLPLGSGAVAGCAFPVSRVLLQGSLGFSAISRNSMDAVADRDFIAEVIFSLALLGTHLSRLAEDLILYGSSEFGFVRFGDGFSTGSSMMPQKRNPDALEIARGSASRMLGDLTALLGTLKGLPSGYNKDLQDDKRTLFDAVDSSLLVIPAVAGTLDELAFVDERMRNAVSSTMMATDLADYLVHRGVSFRDAHAAVGQLIRLSEESGTELHALPRTAFRSAHERFGEDVFDALSPRRSIERRDVDGGTSPNSVKAQIELAVQSLVPPTETRGNELNLRAAG